VTFLSVWKKPERGVNDWGGYWGNKGKEKGATVFSSQTRCSKELDRRGIREGLLTKETESSEKGEGEKLKERKK